MATEIRPSLAQMLNPQPTMRAPQPATPEAANPGGFVSALAAQKAFFQQVTAPPKNMKITPATYTAADIARATQTPPAAPAQPVTADPTQPLKRPGSYLNIVI